MSSSRTKTAVTLAAATLACLAAASAPVAQAATPPTQKICSSNYSAGSLAVLYPSNKDYDIPVGWCKTEVPYGSRVFVEESYRVSYNGDNSSSYSGCRNNTGFVPYQKVSTIWFKSYNKANCKN